MRKASMCLSQILEHLLDSKVFPPLAGIVGVVIGFFLSEWRYRRTIYEQRRNTSLLEVYLVL